jgi:gamma-glutamyltranspeptidase/glutathione hydrolase
VADARRTLRIVVVAWFGMSLFAGANPADRSQGRSLVISQTGIVAAEHPLAAQAGVWMLARGGSAVDAAVAANAVMGLVAPMSNGIGGDLFAIVYEAKSGKLFGLNASGWAPAGLSIELLRAKGESRMPGRGIHTVTVPGTVDGWEKLLGRFGRLKAADVLGPAIRLAEQGFPVTEWVAPLWAESESRLMDASAARTFLPGGRAPRLGEMFRNPDLARTYRAIVERGRAGFYAGSVGDAILACSRANGGTLSAEDLRVFASEWVEPIKTTYHGWTVYEIPPNGQGIAALAMLNLMERFPLRRYGHNSIDALHVMIEAKKLAYADLIRYVADPRTSQVPVPGMLSKDYARRRAAGISAERANCSIAAGTPTAAGDDTIYLSVVDRDGNMVSLIQSNYESVGFGSGLVPEGAGFCLHNRGALFSFDPQHPNALAPRKRPLHTIIPAFMEKDGVRIAFGIMGGWNQAQAHAQFVSNVADHDLNVQAALEAPRFTKPTFEGCDVIVEAGIAEPVRGGLSARGHLPQVRGAYTRDTGGGQAVLRDFRTGVNYGASDPRKDGAAVPEPPAEK